MILAQKTLDSLREMINEKTKYRKGAELVRFFNQLGFNDRYGNGFPSRWVYTDDKLSVINGNPDARGTGQWHQHQLKLRV